MEEILESWLVYRDAVAEACGLARPVSRLRSARA